MPDNLAKQVQIVFEDKNLLVLCKPAGMPCHPLKENEQGTALNFAVAHAPEIAQSSQDWREDGLCHRLDNDTSGLLLFAKNNKTWVKMRQAVRKTFVSRLYYSLIQGILTDKLVIDQPIAHHPKKKKKMMVVVGNKKYRGKPRGAQTIVEPIKSVGDVTLAKVSIQGGCRHQIRVHLEYDGYPIIGDTLYGGPKASYLPGQALHAGVLTLPNGRTFKADWPVDFIHEAKKNNITIASA